MITPKKKQPTTGIFLFQDLARRIKTQTDAQKLLLLYYSTRTDKNGNFYPGLDLIAAETGLSRATVSRINSYFRDHGILTWTKGWGNRFLGKQKGRANTYQFDLLGMQKLAISAHILKSSTAHQGSTAKNSSTAQEAGSTARTTQKTNSSTAQEAGSTAHSCEPLTTSLGQPLKSKQPCKREFEADFEFDGNAASEGSTDSGGNDGVLAGGSSMGMGVKGQAGNLFDEKSGRKEVLRVASVGSLTGHTLRANDEKLDNPVGALPSESDENLISSGDRFICSTCGDEGEFQISGDSQFTLHDGEVLCRSCISLYPFDLMLLTKVALPNSPSTAETGSNVQ